mmetsp:Transcript_33332/g.65474  ORF Transcript_33332/g.65474 Transcript_33332/m.65474 type:complete len:620 (+) Transcript_33332:1855-3714(+)
MSGWDGCVWMDGWTDGLHRGGWWVCVWQVTKTVNADDVRAQHISTIFTATGSFGEEKVTAEAKFEIFGSWVSNPVSAWSTKQPTAVPSRLPTRRPTTRRPTVNPTPLPSRMPTSLPTAVPTVPAPTAAPPTTRPAVAGPLVAILQPYPGTAGRSTFDTGFVTISQAQTTSTRVGRRLLRQGGAGCVDDPTGGVAAAGYTCAQLVPFGCKTDLKPPEGALIEMACPVSCNACPTGAGAGTGGGAPTAASAPTTPPAPPSTPTTTNPPTTVPATSTGKPPLVLNYDFLGQGGSLGGMHVHVGTSCDDASKVGGHYWVPPSGLDPWDAIFWTSQQGSATVEGTGLALADVVGRTVVLHDSTGARWACGVVAQPGTAIPKSVQNSSPPSPYPSYSPSPVPSMDPTAVPTGKPTYVPDGPVRPETQPTAAPTLALEEEDTGAPPVLDVCADDKWWPAECTPWWVWLIAGTVALVLLVSAIVCVRRCLQRRSDDKVAAGADEEEQVPMNISNPTPVDAPVPERPVKVHRSPEPAHSQHRSPPRSAGPPPLPASYTTPSKSLSRPQPKQQEQQPHSGGSSLYHATLSSTQGGHVQLHYNTQSSNERPQQIERPYHFSFTPNNNAQQ